MQEQQQWRVNLLGQLSLQRLDWEVTRFRSPKVGLLLAYLSYFGDRMHLRDDLIEMLWPEAPPQSSRNRLSQVVVWLRSLLEPADVPDLSPGSVLLADRTGLQLDPRSVSVDVADFRIALAQGRRTDRDVDARIQLLVQALELYRGDLLLGFYNDWVLEERERLSQERIGALELLARLHRERSQKGDLIAAEAYARTAVAAEPTREESHRELMSVLAAAGQGAAALRQFHELEQILARELDEKPSAETLAVAEQIRGQPLLSIAAPVRRSTEAPVPMARRETAATPDWATLPIPLTRFFGRETEIAQATQMIHEGMRLITLLGTGGCGKTRLALEIGRRLLPEFAGAVVFVPLADIMDPALILTEIAGALYRKRVGEDSLEQIVAVLAPQPRVLLTLDNLEHLTRGAAAVLRPLLQKLPNLVILTTSRQRLGMEGEASLPVLPLLLPANKEASLESLSEAPSVRLFVDRAQAVRPSFRLTSANASTVAALCARLEGIPLAIELCAVWAEILTPVQMLAQLEDRFALLVSDRSDRPDRHRTLRAAIEYSVTLLPADLRRAFIQLSVFRGGWSLEGAIAVLDVAPPATLEILARLQERSLIVTEESPSGDAMRYRMLETLREFGEAERLEGENGDPTAERHAEYFRKLVETSQANLIGADAMVWLARLETEHDNLRATLQWCCNTGEIETGLILAARLLGFWEIRGYLKEGLEWLDQFLALSETKREALAPARARALFTRARLLRSLGEFDRSYAAAAQSREEAQIAGDARQAMLALYLIGVVASSLERFEDARQALEQSLAEARPLNDVHAIGNILTDLGNLTTTEGKFEESHAFLTESRALFQEVGLSTNEAVALNNLGLIARYQGDYNLARTLLQQALDMHRAAAFRVGFAIAQINLGTLCRLQASETSPALFAEARLRLNEGLTIAWEIGSRYIVAWALKELGSLAIAEKQFTHGIRLLGAADSLREELRMSFRPSDPAELIRDQAAARSAIGEAEFETVWRQGHAEALERSVEEALTPVAPEKENF